MDAAKTTYYEEKNITVAVMWMIAAGFIFIFGSCAALLYLGFQPQFAPVLNGYLATKTVTYHVGCSGSTQDASACLAKALDTCGRKKNGTQTLYVRKISSSGEGKPVEIAFMCEQDAGSGDGAGSGLR